jgi:hypothetical protein
MAPICVHLDKGEYYKPELLELAASTVRWPCMGES